MKWGELLEEFPGRVSEFLTDSSFSSSLGGQLVIELLATSFAAIIGWVFAVRSARSRQRSRLIDELILTQREFAKRAYPDDFEGRWRQSDPREVWMLQPLIDRLRFLSTNINVEQAISARAKLAVEDYVDWIFYLLISVRRHLIEHKLMSTNLSRLRGFLDLR